MNFAVVVFRKDKQARIRFLRRGDVVRSAKSELKYRRLIPNLCELNFFELELPGVR